MVRRASTWVCLAGAALAVANCSEPGEAPVSSPGLVDEGTGASLSGDDGSIEARGHIDPNRCDQRPPPNSLGVVEISEIDDWSLGGGGTGGGGGLGGGGMGGASNAAPDPSGRCACDGTYFTEEAEAIASGLELDPFDYCEVPPGYFGCGEHQCVVGEEVCFSLLSHAGNPEDGFSCVAPPEACAGVAGDPCDCAQEHLEYTSCQAVPAGTGWAQYHRMFVGL